MDKSVQHKLLNLETTPPEGVWQKITEALDDAASGMQFPKKLQELAIAPPVAAWEKIAASLDDETFDTPIAAKLYAAEALPPAGAWHKIQASLDSTHEDVIPRRHRIPAFVKYAAAAVITGFFAFGALYLFNPGTKKADTDTASLKDVIPVIEAIDHANAGLDAANEEASNTMAPNTDEQEARNDAALEASKKTYAKLDITPSKKADIASAYRFSSYFDDARLDEHGSQGYEEALSPEETKADRYILLMTPDGHFIRMSKKLSNLVCCVSGEEQDKNCKSQVDKWRKQLACSDASHPGNFMDILSLVGSLKDN